MSPSLINPYWAAAASAPDPVAILGTDLLAWYKRGAGLYDSIAGGSLITPSTTDGTQIGRWEDQTANAYHLVRPTSLDNGIRWSTSVTNLGFGTVRHGNGAALLGDWKVPDALGTALSGAGVGSIWVTLKANAKNSTTDDGLWNFSASDNPQNYGWSDFHIYEGWGSTVRKDTGAAIIDIAAAFARYHVYSASADWANYLNGTQQFHTGTNTVTFRTTGLKFGVNQSALVWGGWVTEIVIAKIKPSGTQQTNMETYLST